MQQKCIDYIEEILSMVILPSPDSRRVVVRFLQKNVHNTG